MDQPRLDFVQCLGGRGLHRMAYWEWGDAANRRVLVCVHGLAGSPDRDPMLLEELRDRFGGRDRAREDSAQPRRETHYSSAFRTVTSNCHWKSL